MQRGRADARSIDQYAQLGMNPDGTYSLHVKGDPNKQKVVAEELNPLSENASIGDRLFRRRRAMHAMEQLQRMQRGNIKRINPNEYSTIADPQGTTIGTAGGVDSNNEKVSEAVGSDETGTVDTSNIEDIEAKAEAYRRQQEKEYNQQVREAESKYEHESAWLADKENDKNWDVYANDLYQKFLKEGMSEEVAKHRAEYFTAYEREGWDPNEKTDMFTQLGRDMKRSLKNYTSPINWKGELDFADYTTQRSEIPYVNDFYAGTDQMGELVKGLFSDVLTSAGALGDVMLNPFLSKENKRYGNLTKPVMHETRKNASNMWDFLWGDVENEEVKNKIKDESEPGGSW